MHNSHSTFSDSGLYGPTGVPAGGTGGGGSGGSTQLPTIKAIDPQSSSIQSRRSAFQGLPQSLPQSLSQALPVSVSQSLPQSLPQSLAQSLPQSLPRLSHVPSLAL